MAAEAARLTTGELLARLQRHYIKPGEALPGGVFVREVGQNGSWGASSRCDAIYVGFTSTSGRIMVGHELKVSRSDWLHELANLNKADAWADQCHEWYLVTLPGVVQEGELPAGWGLMIPNPKTTTRMQILVKSERKPERFVPSWDAVRSVIARQDTLRAEAISGATRRIREEAWAEQEAKVQERVEIQLRAKGADQERYERMEQELERYRKALGPLLNGEGSDAYRSRGAHTEEELADMAELLRRTGTVELALQEFRGRFGGMDAARRHMEKLEQAVASLGSREVDADGNAEPGTES